MTVAVNGRTWVRTAVSHFEKRRAWASCPRCIGGNMYRETNGEYVCIQCGCSLFPDKVTKRFTQTSAAI